LSTYVCSRELVVQLPGALDVRHVDGPLPELSGIWMRGEPEAALDGAAALVASGDGLRDFVSWAAAHGAAAVIGCGLLPSQFALDELPGDVSLIAWPEADADLSTVRFRIGDALLRAQRRQIERARAIHDRLTRVALDGRGLDELAATLAELIDAPAIVKDRRHRNLAAHTGNARIDAVRRRALAYGATTPDVVEALERDGTFERLRSERRPMHVPANPGLEMSARVMAPVIMGDAYYGYISVARGRHALERIDLMAVEHAATVAALIVGREQAVRAHERNLRSVFVYESIFGREPADVMERRAQYLGYDPADGHAVLVVRALGGERDGARARMEAVAVALDEEIAAATGRAGLCTVVADDLAVALVPARAAESTQIWCVRAERLMQGVFAANASFELVAGLGRWCGDRAALPRSFAEARLAAGIGAHRSGPRSVMHYERLGLYRLLADAVDGEALHAFRREQLGSIEHDPDLIKTLRVYLQTRGNKAQCAKELFVHLNTVKYRLSRIADLTGRNLEDADALLNLHVALEIGDLLPLLGASPVIPSPGNA
jgi:purine catabolism regulator